MTFDRKDFASLPRLTRPLEIETKRAGSDGSITGYASRFSEPDAFGDVIEPGAFRKSLEAHTRENVPVAMLWAHDMTTPLGVWTDLHEDDDGLFVEGKLNLGTEIGREALAHVRGGSVTGLSIGFLTRNRQRNDDGSSTIRELELVEVSLVAVPAARRARISSLGSQHDLETFLHKSGLPHGAARKVAGGGWPALSGPDVRRDQTMLVIARRCLVIADSLKNIRRKK